ncbi:hypothetical protein K504DRAFT_245461 [Pleomassaria siparia CBS 279.74]|uniref:Uncharacterized protein n=1 Tax=Pleomassaria siparia CBS 279.74 TaxID=1314801 RepID=A0A6G1JPJ2_9PLEO|nr:hypothetical protein K504DRAFT_245461 [Pleomassaria siparia CBS 279.74]
MPASTYCGWCIIPLPTSLPVHVPILFHHQANSQAISCLSLTQLRRAWLPPKARRKQRRTALPASCLVSPRPTLPPR